MKLLKKIHQLILSHEKNWIIFGFCSLLIILMLSGTLGYYSLHNSYSDSRNYIESIDLARGAQLEFQRQFRIWTIAVHEGDRFDEFRNNFHIFSYSTDHVQDLLFNLNLSAGSDQDLSERIMELRRKHKKLSGLFVGYLVDFQKKGFRRLKILDNTREPQREMLREIDAIAHELKKKASAEIDRINVFYLNVVLASLSVLLLSALVMSFFLAKGIFRSHDILKQTVRHRTNDLNEARGYLALSEEKNRILFEEARDIIFSCDENFNINSVNQAARRVLKTNPSSLIGKSIPECVHENPGEEGVSRRLIREKLELFLENGDALDFRALIKIIGMIEAQELNIRLQRISHDGKIEILGMASRGNEDPFVRRTLVEKIRFQIESSLMIADDISYRLTSGMLKYLPSAIVRDCRVALREVLINAVEHGNLEISFDEKSRELITGTYFEFISKRQNEYPYKDRSVYIDYGLNNEKAVFKITDLGKGFDHRKVLSGENRSLDGEELLHGRGLAMVMNIFDEVRFNRKGNQVLLIKKFINSRGL